jgi:hypothetical protein
LYTISGNVGAAGTMISWVDGIAKYASCDSSGNYVILVSAGFTGTVTPALPGHTFSPAPISYSDVMSNQTNQNYAATATSEVAPAFQQWPAINDLLRNNYPIIEPTTTPYPIYPEYYSTPHFPYIEPTTTPYPIWELNIN